MVSPSVSYSKHVIFITGCSISFVSLIEFVWFSSTFSCYILLYLWLSKLHWNGLSCADVPLRYYCVMVIFFKFRGWCWAWAASGVGQAKLWEESYLVGKCSISTEANWAWLVGRTVHWWYYGGMFCQSENNIVQYFCLGWAVGLLKASACGGWMIGRPTKASNCCSSGGKLRCLKKQCHLDSCCLLTDSARDCLYASVPDCDRTKCAWMLAQHNGATLRMLSGWHNDDNLVFIVSAGKHQQWHWYR